MTPLGMAAQRTSYWLIGLFILTVLDLGVGPLWYLMFNRGNDVPEAGILDLSIWLGWLWIVVFVVAVWLGGRRALWLLLAAPFALYWPSMWIFVAHACSLTGCR